MTAVVEVDWPALRELMLSQHAGHATRRVDGWLECQPCGRRLAADHVCDTCRAPCQGGCVDYVSARLQPRHGCADDRACARAWRRRRFRRSA